MLEPASAVAAGCFQRHFRLQLTVLTSESPQKSCNHRYDHKNCAREGSEINDEDPGRWIELIEIPSRRDSMGFTTSIAKALW